MADEIKNQGNEPTGGAQPSKTFTQAEVDAIVGDRLSRERAKYADYDQLKEKAGKFDQQEEAAKTDLQKAQDAAASLQKQLDDMKAQNAARDARDKVAAAKGVPAHLLSGSTEEECSAQADKLLAWRGNQKQYPSGVKDGGEVPPTGGGKTRDQFADWFESVTKTT